MSFNLYDLPIKKKLLLGISLSLIVCIAASFLYLSDFMRTRIAQDADQQGLALAQTYADQVENEMVKNRMIAKSLAAATKTYTENKQTDRDFLVNYARTILIDNPEIYGVWIDAVPNELDHTDANHKDNDSYGSNGRFSIYWTRESGDQIVRQKPVAYDKVQTEDYFKIPAETKRVSVIEPYVDGTSNVLMVSVAAPVLVDGKVVAVAGIDKSLAGLTAQIQLASA